MDATIDYRSEFYRIANLAIKAGVLTVNERDLISRRGTRKASYFARHLRDLCSVLAERDIDEAMWGEIYKWLTPVEG